MSTKLVKCPDCRTLIKESKLPKHLFLVHHKGTYKPNPAPPTSSDKKIKAAPKRKKSFGSISNPNGIEYEDGIIYIPGVSGSSRSPAAESRDPRDYNLGIPRCPHGVLKTSPCAICNPKEFKRMTGID